VILKESTKGKMLIPEDRYYVEISKTINYIMAQRLSLFAHVYRMTNDRIVKIYMSGDRYLQNCQEGKKLKVKRLKKIKFKSIKMNN
jgi:hypothetical protein